MFVIGTFSARRSSYSEITAKKEESPEQALKEFAAIVDQDNPMSDWYTVPMYQLLSNSSHTKSTVTRNYAEKTINGILDYVGGGKGGPVEVTVLEKFYQATKDALQEARNEV